MSKNINEIMSLQGRSGRCDIIIFPILQSELRNVFMVASYYVIEIICLKTE